MLVTPAPAVKSNVPEPPAVRVLTGAEQRLVLVNVRTTDSPGSTLNVATRVPTLPLETVAEAPSLQVRAVRSQPDFVFSVKVYVPGTTSCAADVAPEARPVMFVTPAPAVKSNVPEPPSV